MKTYFKIIQMTFHKAGKEYILYLFLCLFEVMRNLALLASAHFGLSLLTNPHHNESHTLIFSVLAMLVCELASVLINGSMNRLEERLESLHYREILSKSSRVPLALLYENHYQKLIRDALEEGTPSISRLAVDLSAYLEMLCQLGIFLLVAWRAGFLFVIVAVTCMGIAQWQEYIVENKQETERENLSTHRNKRKYYTDLMDEEKVHAEVVVQDVGKYFQAQP